MRRIPWCDMSRTAFNRLLLALFAFAAGHLRPGRSSTSLEHNEQVRTKRSTVASK